MASYSPANAGITLITTFAPYLYVPNASGGFDHVGILRDVGRNTVDFDISGRTIVMAMASDGLDTGPVRVYALPESLVAPPAIANNFDARNVSGFTLTPGSGFELLGNSSNYYFRQTVASRDAAAVYNDTDWSFYQSIEADVTPSSWDLSTSYSGVAVRYVDDNNFYFAGIKSNGNLVLGRKLNGATKILAQRGVERGAPCSPSPPTDDLGHPAIRGHRRAVAACCRRCESCTWPRGTGDSPRSREFRQYLCEAHERRVNAMGIPRFCRSSGP